MPFCCSSSIGRVRRNFIKDHSRKLVIRSFLLEVPANKTHKGLDMAYNTAYKICHKIREAIYQFVKEDDMLSGEIEMDEGYFADERAGKRGRGAEDKMPVFGLLEKEGRVKVEVVKRILKETIEKVKRGSIIYTDRFGS